MEQDEIFLKIKDQICNTLISDNQINKNYLEFFGLGDENFSKSLRSQLEKFIKEIKYNKEIFTTLEKEKLMFIENKANQSCSEIDDDLSIYICNKKNLETLRLNLKNLNLKLKIEKEKIGTENLNKRNKLLASEKNTLKNDDGFKINFDFVLNKIQTIVNQNKNNRNDYRQNLKSASLNENICEQKPNNSSSFEKILSFKNKIIELNEENKILKQEKSEYEKKLNKFLNLPSDLNKIKEMIRLKKEEYSSLN
jgi:hypothetical protein